MIMSKVAKLVVSRKVASNIGKQNFLSKGILSQARLRHYRSYQSIYFGCYR